MAANDKNLITCVEFGTHSVRALHGMSDKAGNPVVVGVGQEPSDGAVCKGEIIDAQKTPGGWMYKVRYEANGNVYEHRYPEFALEVA